MSRYNSMRLKGKYWSVVCLLLFLVSCGQKSKNNAQAVGVAVSTSDSSRSILPEYAEGFEVQYVEGGCLVTIQDPQKEKGKGEIYQYAFVRDKEAFAKNKVSADYVVQPVPIKNIICMTSLQLSNFIKLDELDHVVGITSTRHLFNEEVKRRLKEKKIRKIGIEGNFDNEVIISMNPDLILISPFKRGGYDALKEVGIPLIPHLGYKENSPLGQAEWIKFIGLLIGEEEKANAIFDSIKTEYNTLKQLTAKIEKMPVVFSGELRGGNWYAVGGRNFLAQLFRDAGADYFLKDDPNTGGVTLDFETVYSRAESADYWRILNSHNGTFTYDALKAQDSRYADFRAFKDKGVIYCNLKEKPYYENVPTHPEVLLKDLIKVFHPELLPEYTPVFYELLK
ncbi:ABC transporter substrate-binding protein [Bacteroides sp. 90-K9/2]|uniref:ABC transporter substrate-binding protein n=1 Tax=Bacteroides sp. 90-K9/2 TaxID=3142453 RepID=UPI0039B3C83B